MTTAVAQYASLSQRSIMTTIRQPIAIVPSLTFPLLFLAINSAALNRSIELPGFPPVDSFLQFMIATTIVQGGLFGAVASGSAIAADIEGGFFDRLIVTPVARTSILVGRLAGSFSLAFTQAWLFFGVAHLFGLMVQGGFAAMFAVALVSSIASAGLGSLSVAIGLKSGSTEVVQGSFPLIFVSMFLSSAFFPRSLMEGWFKSVATINPLSHMIEGTRSLVIRGWDTSEFLMSLGIAAAILLVGVGVSLVALRGRLALRD